MRNHAFHADEVRIGCCFLLRQDKRRIKDVQRFIFHRAHIKITDRNDVKDIKVIFQAINIFIPLHRAF